MLSGRRLLAKLTTQHISNRHSHCIDPSPDAARVPAGVHEHTTHTHTTHISALTTHYSVLRRAYAVDYCVQCSLPRIAFLLLLLRPLHFSSQSHFALSLSLFISVCLCLSVSRYAMCAFRKYFYCAFIKYLVYRFNLYAPFAVRGA